MEVKGLHIHCCLLDPHCRQHGPAPARLHITIGKRHLGIALTPNSTFGRATRQPDGSWGPPYTDRWFDYRVVD